MHWRLYQLSPFSRHRRRAAIVKRYLGKRDRLASAWTPMRTETSNFYYAMTEISERYMLHALAIATGAEFEALQGYARELEADDALRGHIQAFLHSSRKTRDARVAYARRIGWYAATRAVKPRLVVETGVFHGVGACVIAAALLRNRAEGAEGRYIGTEINTAHGRLFNEKHREVGEIIYQDSIETLKSLEGPLDLFINDSDHSGAYEFREYEAIASILSDKALIISDNASGCDSLVRFSEQTGRRFLYAKEDPAEHWYKGAGLGLSFR